MSFNIVLMMNKQPLNQIRKSPTTIATLTGTLKENSSIITPSITIERQDPTGFNYIHIPVFNRYYFVNDVFVIRTNLLEISCACDVLMSFQNEILNQTALIKRNANDWNLYINDNNFISYSNTKLITKKFPNSFSGSSYVLATMNGT